MKKSLINLTQLFCITLIIFATIVTGCGKSEKEKTYDALEQELISVGTDEDEAEEIVKVLKELEEESVVEESFAEETVNDFNSLSFEPMEEIQNASLYECKIQIADLLVTPTTIIGDFFSQVENSSITWEYEYNPEQLVPKNESFEMTLAYSGTEIISFKAYNISEDTLTLKECLLFRPDINSYFVTSNIYYGNGYCIDGKNVPNYTEFKDLAKKYHRYAGEFEQLSMNGEQIIIDFTLHSCDIIVPSLFLKAPIWMNYKFSFDSSDGKCTSVEIADSSLSILAEPFDETIENNEFLPIGINTLASIINEDFIGTYIDDNGNKLVLDEFGRAWYNDLPGLLLYWSYEDNQVKLAKLQSTSVLFISDSSSSSEILTFNRTEDREASSFKSGTYTKTE